MTATVALIVSAMVLWILYGMDRRLRYSRRIVLFAERRKIMSRKRA